MVKRILLIIFFIFGIFTQANAGPSALFGISYNFGATAGDWGMTVKVLSDDEEDHFVASAGVSFFPFVPEKKIGIDFGGGYLCHDGAAVLGWDFLHKKPQLSIGYVNADDDDSSSSPSDPTPEPTPDPA